MQDDEASMAVLVSRLMGVTELLMKPGPAPLDAAISEEVATAAKSSGAAIEKAFAIELCNQLYRLSKSVTKAQEQGGSDALKLKGHLDRLGKILDERSVRWEDLTGQAYHPGRADFEPLGEPQTTPGLLQKTIIKCERPAIRLDGAIIQLASGTVGKPLE